MTERSESQSGVENSTPEEFQAIADAFGGQSANAARLLPVELDKLKDIRGFNIGAATVSDFITGRNEEWERLQRALKPRDTLNALFVEAYILYCVIILHDPGGNAALTLLPAKKQIDFKHSHLATIALWLVMSKVKGNNYRNRKALREALLRGLEPKVLSSMLIRKELNIGKLAKAFDARGLDDDLSACTTADTPNDLSPASETVNPIHMDDAKKVYSEVKSLGGASALLRPSLISAPAETAAHLPTPPAEAAASIPSGYHAMRDRNHIARTADGNREDATALFDTDMDHHAGKFSIGDVVTITAVVVQHKVFQVGEIAKLPSIGGYQPRVAPKIQKALRILSSDN